MKSKNNHIKGIIENGLKEYVPKKHISKIIKLVEKSSNEFKEMFTYTDGIQKNELNNLSIDVWSNANPDEQLVFLSYKKRVPTETSKRRKPVRCGGEKCYTIKWGDRTYTICIGWEGPCNTNIVF